MLFSNSKIAELETHIKKLEKDNASLMQAKFSFEQTKASLMNKYEKDIETLKGVVETEKKSVARKVNQSLARMGVTKFAPEEICVETQNSPLQVYETFLSLAGKPEQQEYFTKHEKVISSFHNLK